MNPEGQPLPRYGCHQAAHGLPNRARFAVTPTPSLRAAPARECAINAPGFDFADRAKTSKRMREAEVNGAWRGEELPCLRLFGYAHGFSFSRGREPGAMGHRSSATRRRERRARCVVAYVDESPPGRLARCSEGSVMNVAAARCLLDIETAESDKPAGGREEEVKRRRLHTHA